MPHPQYQFDVRADATFVADRARFVHIDRDAIAAWASGADPAPIKPIVRPTELKFTGSPGDLTRWLLLIDCLNFCFWTIDDPPWEVDYRGRTWRRYYALMACLHRAVGEDRAWLDPCRWTTITPDVARHLFRGRGSIPMFDERVRILNDIGRTTSDRLDGDPLKLVEAARFDAVRIACSLAETFESFRDVHAYNAKSVAMLKRAQIFAADLAVALRDNGGPCLVNLEGLTAFADYRIPQALRHLGIVKLDAGLERRIEAGELIAPSSDAEIELRACSIHAVDLMAQALASERAVRMPAWVLDEYLWERSHDPQVTVQHHRTQTLFY